MKILTRSILLLSILFVIESKAQKLDLANNKSNEIHFIKIGNQYWMSENLNCKYFKNGDKIPVAKTKKEWLDAAKNKQAAWCYYENDTLNGSIHGVLYNAYALTDPRGIIPDNCKIPNKEDWEKLIRYCKTKEQAGYKLKAEYGWDQNGNGSNEFKFTALPSGYRRDDGQFIGLKTECGWWSLNINKYEINEVQVTNGSTSGENSFSAEMTPVFLIWSDDSMLGTEDVFLGSGYSVRCLKE